MTVLVAGAGIGGLTAALSLRTAGIPVTVVESARRIRPLGVGINLLPHAVRELVELGLGGELAAIGVATAENVYCDHHGNRVFTEPRGMAAGYRWPQYSVHRGELQMLLLDAVRDRVRTGARVEDFEQTSRSVRVRLTDTGRSEELEADALIGADGIRSAVRARLHPGEGPLLWSGTVMWRGTTTAPPMLTGRSMLIAMDDRHVQFLAYPIGRGRINWVAQVPMGEPGPLAEGGRWNRAGRPEDVLPHYEQWEFDWLDIPGLIRGSAGILEYPMVDREPLPSWGNGRVSLLGDAAHPMYPVGANGASQSVVDARVLARELAATGDPVAGLTAYERARRDATAAVVLANRRMDRAARNDGAALGAVTATYRASTGADVAALNGRASLNPLRSG